MNKYQYDYNNISNSEFSSLLMPDETIIWSGKPKKNAYVLNRSMTMMPFALIWLLFDGTFIVTFLKTGIQGQMGRYGVCFDWIFCHSSDARMDMAGEYHNSRSKVEEYGICRYGQENYNPKRLYRI